jgi:hypothetical protein
MGAPGAAFRLPDAARRQAPRRDAARSALVDLKLQAADILPGDFTLYARKSPAT